MKIPCEINTQLGIPIYQQLVDTIRAGIKKGTMAPGQQLPTVQELASDLGIARGTIKRAYDELEHQGLLEKIQGRGTFVCYQPANSGSRKEKAMAAIDTLLDQLEEMGFSATEIGIFLSLKQRERTESLSTLKVAVVECNPENVSQMSHQMLSIKGIELYSYQLDSIQQYPYKLDEEMDIVITTPEHAEYLESVLSDRRKIARVAVRLSTKTLASLVKLRTGDTVGILCASNRFCDLLYNSCRSNARGVKFQKPQTFGGKLNIEEYLASVNVVLVPEDYEKYCSQQEAQKLKAFGKQGKLIPCAYEMDEGSFLYLEEKLRLIREEKTK